MENLVSMNDIVKIYENKKILITGHTGFKGSWLSIWLKELGAQVIGYSLEPPTEPSNFEACGLHGRVIHIHGDVRNQEQLLSVFKEYKPEFVFHLAAQPLVRLSYNEPRMTYETNVMGTVNLFEAVRAIDSVRVVINITSDKCYENKAWVWGYRENDPMGGYDPYSSSKGCAELVTAAYRKSFFDPEKNGDNKVALSSVRAGNVIGGGDWGQDRLVPDCARALSCKKPIAIRNPGAIRPWQHVLDPLFGYLLLGAKMYDNNLIYSGAWNFGPSVVEDMTVEELVQMMIKYWGSGSFTVPTSSQPPESSVHHEAEWLKLDCSKACRFLRWKPRYNIEKALYKTVEWYKMYYNGANKEEIYQNNRLQIIKYMEGFQKKKEEWHAGIKENDDCG